MSEDRVMHFLSTVGDSCLQAHMGKLNVSVKTRDGTVHTGVPAARPVPDQDPDAIDSTGYADDVVINGTHIKLSEVHTVQFWCP